MNDIAKLRKRAIDMAAFQIVTMGTDEAFSSLEEQLGIIVNKSYFNETHLVLDCTYDNKPFPVLISHDYMAAIRKEIYQKDK